ncbi:hypothetical protein M885DRAFT_572323 [Pelagophyceae sp. CCMP2097]|nr:hypothetical protein M885DRAFT_572323 [Pelagophyceae sp. CCMP2097]
MDERVRAIDECVRAMDEGVRINCWSGPRCLSTALMYSWAQRKDATCVDEPLYAHHLTRCPGVFRPYRAELLRSQDADGSRVVAELAARPVAGALYAKHMAKHRVALGDAAFCAPFANVLLIRDPRRVVASFHAKVRGWAEDAQDAAPEGAAALAADAAGALFDETGFGDLATIYDAVERLTGAPPVVVSADRLQAAPEETLRALCAALRLPFDAAMLAWAPGPKRCDGLWAHHWYDSVHASSGFRPTPLQPPPATPDHLRHVVDRCLPIYRKLARRAVAEAVANELPL